MTAYILAWPAQGQSTLRTNCTVACVLLHMYHRCVLPHVYCSMCTAPHVLLHLYCSMMKSGSINNIPFPCCCLCAGIGCESAPSNVTDCYQWFISTSDLPWTACTEYVDFDCCAKSATQRAYCEGQGLNCTDLNYGVMGCSEVTFTCPEGEGAGHTGCRSGVCGTGVFGCATTARGSSC
jgi:hypothetical protein